MELLIRDANIEDADALAALEKEIDGVFRPEYWLDELNRFSYPPVCLCAVRGDDVVGLALGQIRMGEFGFEEDAGWLINIGVRDDVRGNGVGRRLMDAAIERFRSLGVRRIYSISEDKRLLAFMQSAGFKKAENLQTLEFAM
ncbi:MAG: GNAT family N-acetyltransferase [Actinomycetota bacterium]